MQILEIKVHKKTCTNVNPTFRSYGKAEHQSYRTGVRQIDNHQMKTYKLGALSLQKNEKKAKSNGHCSGETNVYVHGTPKSQGPISIIRETNSSNYKEHIKPDLSK